MEILNIIEKMNGEISNITSFPVLFKESKEDIVDFSEDKFKSIIKEVKNIKTDSDDFAEEPTILDSYVEDGYYTDKDGWELILSWSDKVEVMIPSNKISNED